jgi:hypothetical protein
MGYARAPFNMYTDARWFSCSILTVYGLDDQGSIPGRGEIFSSPQLPVSYTTTTL